MILRKREYVYSLKTRGKIQSNEAGKSCNKVSKLIMHKLKDNEVN